MYTPVPPFLNSNRVPHGFTQDPITDRAHLRHCQAYSAVCLCYMEEDAAKPRAAAVMYACVHQNGVAYRRTMATDDRVRSQRGPGPGARLVARPTECGEWLEANVEGLGTVFLPMRSLGRGNFERVAGGVAGAAQVGSGEQGAAAASSRTAIALHDFAKAHDDDLSFVAGDVIHSVVIKDGGWATGTLNGTTGVFPANYVALEREVPLSVHTQDDAPAAASVAAATGTGGSADDEDLSSYMHEALSRQHQGQQRGAPRDDSRAQEWSPQWTAAEDKNQDPVKEEYRRKRDKDPVGEPEAEAAVVAEPAAESGSLPEAGAEMEDPAPAVHVGAAAALALGLRVARVARRGSILLALCEARRRDRGRRPQLPWRAGGRWVCLFPMHGKLDLEARTTAEQPEASVRKRGARSDGQHHVAGRCARGAAPSLAAARTYYLAS